jgi:pheromone shutdown protein TraB
VTVVGTAHVSEESVAEVERTIDEVDPDVVAVELDEGRYRQLRGEDPEDLDAADLLRGNTVFQFLAYWMLSYVQNRLGDRFDVRPGAEMLAAVEAARARDAGVALVDRDIQVTIQRFWTRLSPPEKLKLVGGLALGATDPVTLGLGLGAFVGVFVGVPLELLAGPLVLGSVGGPGLLIALADLVLIVSAVTLLVGGAVAALFGLADDGGEDVEFDPDELTDADAVTAMLEAFRDFSPGGAEALIDERDAYIAHELLRLRETGARVVAVVGAGHQRGIERYLADPESLPPRESLLGRETGRRFSLYRLFGYLFTLGFLVFFVLVAMAGVRSSFLLTLFGAWFLVNGIVSFGMAKLAGAHWTSAGVGGAVAWLTSVNPLLAPGWFAGYVELRYITVNVGDITRLNEILDDEEAPIGELFTRMREVSLFRLILIVAATNVGSFVASVLFATVLIPILFQGAGIESVDGVVELMVQGARRSVDLVVRSLP